MHAANGDDGVDGRPGLVTELLPRCMPHTKCHYERRFFSSHSPKTLDEVCHYGITHTYTMSKHTHPHTHTESERERERHAHNVAITSLWSKKFAYSIIQFKVFKSNFKHHNEVALYGVLFLFLFLFLFPLLPTPPDSLSMRVEILNYVLINVERGWLSSTRPVAGLGLLYLRATKP